eukprot:UC1_evm2s445
MSFLAQTDDAADAVLRRAGKYLLPTARVFLLGTFLEDSMRMVTDWGDQAAYFKRQLFRSSFLGHFFVIFNLTLQLGPSILILARKHVRPSVVALCVSILLQTLLYHLLWDLHAFLRNLAVVGGLLFLVRETMDKKDRFAGNISVEDPHRAANMLQLAGRLLIVIMFLTMLKFDSAARIAVEAVGLLLVLCVGAGFQAKASAMALVVLLTLQNFWFNAFWSASKYEADFMRYDFFQTLSVVGGLLMIVALGPGGVSIDSSKKAF